MKKQAFTTIEIILVFSVIIFIVISTVLITISCDNIKEKNIALFSKNFYTNIQLSYNIMLENDIQDGNVTNVLSSAILRDLFIKYMSGQRLECSNLHIQPSSSIVHYTDNLQCAIFPNENMMAGFYLDNTCTTEVITKEYFNKELKTRNIDNACVRIVYATNHSKGLFGMDLFTVALGKKGLL